MEDTKTWEKEWLEKLRERINVNKDCCDMDGLLCKENYPVNSMCDSMGESSEFFSLVPYTQKGNKISLYVILFVIKREGWT